ncbi:MAG: hypothetical protein IKT31_02760 [Firmicutes bacterium]|nr:hypothetical protein [Bacillota bacterium]
MNQDTDLILCGRSSGKGIQGMSGESLRTYASKYLKAAEFRHFLTLCENAEIFASLSELMYLPPACTGQMFSPS